MRLLITTFLALVSLVLFSQSPEKINYQSIVRDLAGNVIQNQPISLRMSILSDSINGTIVYQETFQPTTNNFGLVNIKIGEGTPVIATMSSVDWSNGPFFLESAVDVTGGTNYIVVSTSQFMSVPYALYAKESPLDTTQVQNIVNQQTNNFLDSTSIQNMIDSSVLNIDSTLIASWGYIDSNSIMILINNNSLDSTTIQNMIDNSIVNIDSSTVASWGYLDSSTIQILINNSTIDSSSVSNWGYLDSTTIQNIITQQTNNYLDSTSVQNMIDNSVTNIDSSTVASWGYVDSSSIMILINNNSLDSAAIQNMINSSITNVDSSTVASWGYLDSSSIIALISNSNIDSSSVASWGYLDSVSIQNMINNSSINVDSTMIANFGFVAGPHTIDTDTQIDSTGIANYGFVTSSQVLDSSSVQNMINNSSSNVDSSTVSNWGFVDSSTVINLINQSGYLDSLTVVNMINSGGGTGGITFIDPVALFSGTTYSYSNTTFVYHEIQPGWSSQTPNLTPHNSVYLNKDTLTINIDSILGVHYDNFLITCITSMNNNYSSTYTPISSVFVLSNNVNDVIPIIYNEKNRISNQSSQLTSSSVQCIIPNSDNGIINLGYEIYSASVSLIVTGYINNTSGSGSNSTIDSTTVANWGFSTDTDTQIDSTGIANLGYVAGPHTIDTDTQIDSAGIAAMGYLDSVSIRNMINQYYSNSSGGSGTGGGSSFIFPEGYNGMPITHFFGNGSYTVPTGKSLYVTNRYSGSGDLKINNTTVSSGTNNYGGGSLGLLLPLILNSGDILSSTSSNSSFHGFLVEENLSSITHPFGSGNYTVPSDKTLYILNRYSGSGDLKINNTTVSSGTNNYGGGSAGLLLPIIVSPGDIVSSTSSSTSFNGYLADTSYFESSGSNIDSAAISDMGFVDSSAVIQIVDSIISSNDGTIDSIVDYSSYINDTVQATTDGILMFTFDWYGSSAWNDMYGILNIDSTSSLNSQGLISLKSRIDGNTNQTTNTLQLNSGHITAAIKKDWYFNITKSVSPVNISRVVWFPLKVTNSSSSSGSGSNANTLIYTTNGF